MVRWWGGSHKSALAALHRVVETADGARVLIIGGVVRRRGLRRWRLHRLGVGVGWGGVRRVLGLILGQGQVSRRRRCGSVLRLDRGGSARCQPVDRLDEHRGADDVRGRQRLAPLSVHHVEEAAVGRE